MSDSSTTMTYQIGTVFRMYNNDSSKHYTAIMLKDGKLLEVKNPDGGRVGTKFNSVEEFKTDRQMEGGKLVVDTSKAGGLPIGEDTHGFKYPRVNESRGWSAWPRWFYNVLLELTPYLLEREDVRDAYNLLVDALEACNKRYMTIYSNMSSSKSMRFYGEYLKWNEGGKFKGMPIYFSNETYCSQYNRQFKQQDYDEAREKILTSYKQLYDITHVELHAIMEKRDKVAQLEGSIHDKVKRMGIVKRRIVKLEDQVKSWTGYYVQMGEDACKMRYEVNKLMEIEERVQDNGV